METRGSVFVITGASSGIGAATARLAHEQGAKVVGAARRLPRLKALAAELPGLVPVETDVTQPGEIAKLMAAAVDSFDRIDVLINNAGRGLHVPLEEVEIEGFREILELNVVAPLVAMQAVIPTMRAQGGGAIVNVVSATARMVIPGMGAYSASKAALALMSRVARTELAKDGISVSTVYPAVTATEFHGVLRQGAIRTGGRRVTPHTAEHVAEGVLGLVRSGEEELVLSQDWG